MLNEKIYTVNETMNLFSSIPSGSYSEEEYSVAGYVIDKPTSKNSLGKLSFTIADDIINPKNKITVFLAHSEEEIKQFDKVIVKSYLKVLNEKTLLMTEKKATYEEISTCNVISVEKNKTKDYSNLAVANENISVLEFTTYLDGMQEHYPISDEFIEKYQQLSGGYIALAKSLGKIVDRQKHEPDQKWHFFESWFNECLTEGTISMEDDAKKNIYQRLLCPELLLWIFEAMSVEPSKVKQAMESASKDRVAGTHIATLAKNIRTIVAWEDVIAILKEQNKATSVILSKTSLELNVGEESYLTANVLPIDTTDLAYWSISQEEDVISITSNNNEVMVKALKEGSAKIKVTYNANVYAECVVNVIDNTISLSGLPKTLDLDISDSYKLNPKLNKGEANFNFKSNDSNIVTIDNDGLITALSYGSTIVSVSCVEYPELSKTINIEVFNHGSEKEPLSVRSILNLLESTHLENGDFTYNEVYVSGIIKENPTTEGAFNLLDLDDSSEIKITNSTNNVSIAQNDKVVVKGILKVIENKLQLDEVEILGNERGESIITFNKVDNVIVKVDNNEVTTSQKINNGGKFSFTVEVLNEFVIKEVKVNNIVVEPINGVYTFIVKGNAMIHIDTIDPSLSLVNKYEISFDLGTRVTAKKFENISELASSFIYLGEETGIISSISQMEYIYGGANGGRGDTAWYIGDIIKIGTTSVNGSITFELNGDINYIKITGYIYDTSAKIRVGDSSSSIWNSDTDDSKTTLFTCSDMNIANKDNVENRQLSTIVITFNKTNSITIATTNKKPIFITSIEFGLNNDI